MLLMAGLLAVGVSAQSTKPVAKSKKPIKKVKKVVTADTMEKPKPKPTPSKVIVKKDTIKNGPHYCPACGMG